MENKDKGFYLNVRGKEVEVSEEVYRAYIRPIRNEQRRKRREWRCRVKGKNGKFVRCQNDCKECPYALSGQNALGNKLSLDRMRDDGADIEDCHLDVAQNYITDEEKKELYGAINKLTSRQKEIVNLIYFEQKTQEEAAAIIGVSHQAISKALKKILAELKSFF